MVVQLESNALLGWKITDIVVVVIIYMLCIVMVQRNLHKTYNLQALTVFTDEGFISAL